MQLSGGRASHTEGAASAKALREEHDQLVLETAKRLAELAGISQGSTLADIRDVKGHSTAIKSNAQATVRTLTLILGKMENHGEVLCFV